jgi:hypothetical protein
VRSADISTAASLVSAAAAQASPVDMISKTQVLRKLAVAQEKAGDREGAQKSAALASSLVPKVKKAA